MAAVGLISWAGCGQGPPPGELAWLKVEGPATIRSIAESSHEPEFPVASDGTSSREPIGDPASAPVAAVVDVPAEKIAPPVDHRSSPGGSQQSPSPPGIGPRLIDVYSLEDASDPQEMFVTHLPPVGEDEGAHVEQASPLPTITFRGSDADTGVATSPSPGIEIVKQGQHPKGGPLIVESLPHAPDAPQPPRKSSRDVESDRKVPTIVGTGSGPASPLVITLPSFLPQESGQLSNGSLLAPGAETNPVLPPLPSASDVFGPSLQPEWEVARLPDPRGPDPPLAGSMDPAGPSAETFSSPLTSDGDPPLVANDADPRAAATDPDAVFMTDPDPLPAIAEAPDFTSLPGFDNLDPAGIAANGPSPSDPSPSYPSPSYPSPAVPSLAVAVPAPQPAPQPAPATPAPRGTSSRWHAPPPIANSTPPTVPVASLPLDWAPPAGAAPPRSAANVRGASDASMAAQVIDPTQGQRLVRHAFALANRGMLFAARKEFMAGIHAIAQAKDVAAVTGRYTQLVDEGFAILKESDDFQPDSGGQSRFVDVTSTARSHRTEFVRRFEEDQGQPPSALAAVAAYHRQASDALGEAMAGDPSGSMALYGLAKFHAQLASQSVESRARDTRKAIALYHAALLSHPRNHLAAHEMGVHFAQQRRYDLAEQYLARSMLIRPTSTTCRNLEVVQRRRGQHALAAATARRSEYLSAMAAQQQLSGRTQRGPVQWVDPAVFAASRGGVDFTAGNENGRVASDPSAPGGFAR